MTVYYFSSSMEDIALSGPGDVGIPNFTARVTRCLRLPGKSAMLAVDVESMPATKHFVSVSVAAVGSCAGWQDMLPAKVAPGIEISNLPLRSSAANHSG